LTRTRALPLVVALLLVVTVVVLRLGADAETSKVSTPASTTSSPSTSTTTTTAVPVTTATVAAATTTSTTAPHAAAAVTTTTPAAVTPAAPPAQLIDEIADTGGASKVITVDAASWGSKTATMLLWQRGASGWQQVAGPWTTNVGYGGWAWEPGESTGRTPVGSFTFGIGFGTYSNPGYGLGWFDIQPDDYWVEDPASPDYNTHQKGPADPSQAPWGHFEHLMDYGVSYRYAALINFNVPAQGGIGSGIFLHETTGGTTAGCVALPEAQLVQALQWIDGGTRIIMAPDDTIRSL
jgi:L,D-peptidoglycan transpeptidase YkuD (ErfK/YbiS/YcfS/YnhG family)